MQSVWDPHLRPQGFQAHQQRSQVDGTMPPYSLASLLQSSGGQGGSQSGYQDHAQSYGSSRTPSLSGPSGSMPGNVNGNEHTNGYANQNGNAFAGPSRHATAFPGPIMHPSDGYDNYNHRSNSLDAGHFESGRSMSMSGPVSGMTGLGQPGSLSSGTMRPPPPPPSGASGRRHNQPGLHPSSYVPNGTGAREASTLPLMTDRSHSGTVSKVGAGTDLDRLASTGTGDELDLDHERDQEAYQDQDVDVEDGGGGREKKRKKRRVAAHTCEQCTKRKQKCNKVIPCQHCIARGIADQCVLYIPEWLTVPQPDMNPTNVGTAIASINGHAGRNANATVNGNGSTTTTSSKRKRRKAAMNPEGVAVGDQADEGSRERDLGGQSDGSGPGLDVMKIEPGLSSDVGGASALPMPQAKGVGMSLSLDRMDRSSTSMDQGSGRMGFGMGMEEDPSLGGVGMQNREMGLMEGMMQMERSRTTLEEGAFQMEVLSRMARLESLLASRKGTSGNDQTGDTSPLEGGVASVRTFATGAASTTNLTKGDPENTPPISPVLRRLLRNAGIHPTRLTDLISDLPPYTFSSSLVDQFFAQINPMRYPIHESSFRKAMDGVYQKKDIGGPDPENLKNLPLIFIILATSVMRAPEELAGSRQERKLTSLRMYWSCRRAFLIAASIQPESLELVVTGLLLTVYLIQIHDRRLTEAWSILGASVRTAQAIGCHRDGTKLGLDSVATEYRRRIWSHLFHADRHYSLILGRPPSISESYYDVQEPSNIDLCDIVPNRPITSRPLDEPTSSTFMVLRNRFALITGQVAHHFQKLHQVATYSEVEALDAALLAFIEDLPPHFRVEGADTSLDDKLTYLGRHRYSLATEIMFIRIILHRPWLLRKFWNDKYALSRRACFEAAKVDFRLRQNFRKTYTKAASQIHGQFREFNAAMIAGISAIISPRAPDAEEMRLILTTFLERHPMEQQGDAPHATQKENAIIYTLYRRSIQVFENVGLEETSAHFPGSDPVALLLGLRGEDVTAPPLRAGPEPGDDSYYSQPEFGEEKSTAVMVRDIYATMLRKGMVDRLPHRSPERKNDVTQAPDITQKSQPVEQSELQSPTALDLPTPVQQDGTAQQVLPEAEEDPQQLFDNWLSTNSFLAGASNGMSSVGLGEGNFAPVSNGFPYIPGLEGLYTGLAAPGPAPWIGMPTSGMPNYMETAYSGPHPMPVVPTYENGGQTQYGSGANSFGVPNGIPNWQ